MSLQHFEDCRPSRIFDNFRTKLCVLPELGTFQWSSNFHHRIVEHFNNHFVLRSDLFDRLLEPVASITAEYLFEFRGNAPVCATIVPNKGFRALKRFLEHTDDENQKFDELVTALHRIVLHG